MIPDSLSIVRGAVSTKDLVPVLKHLAFNSGYIHGFNGHVHICTFDENLAELPVLTVPADRALKALDACADEPAALYTEGNALLIQAGRFCARLPFGPIEDYPLAEPERVNELPCEELLDVFTVLHDFVSSDASRPWSQGVLLRDGCAYATNNVVLAAVDLPESLLHLPSMTVPLSSIDEILRIGLVVNSLAYDDSTLTFFLCDGRTWVRSSLIKEDWPDAAGLLANVHEDAELRPFPVTFQPSVEKLFGMVKSELRPVILFRAPKMLVASSLAEEPLASIEGFDTLPEGTYNAQSLELVTRRATHADWTRWPRVPWMHADGVRGVLVGLRP
jgi:DNA polymerase III sliding clamp (beta) subunit (PCNA family)